MVSERMFNLISNAFNTYVRNEPQIILAKTMHPPMSVKATTVTTGIIVNL
jgi:hypothetical protein